MGEQLHIDPTDRNLELMQPDGRAAAGVDQEFLLAGLTRVQGPKRSGLGIGTPVPSSVTRKSDLVMN
jgi:hypothetical protein